jgi:aldehyde dehydrogenase (NAD+)
MACTAAGERRERLKRLRRAIERREAEIIEAIRTDLRRSPFESEIAEIHKVLLEIGYAVKRLPRWMRTKRARTPIVLASTSARIVYEPRGVVLIIAPWNFPFSLIVNPLVAAIAAGNCVVIKPSEKAPATAALLESLIGEVFDEAEVAVVQGGPDVGQALLELPFDHFFFTGGTEVGRTVMAAAARHLATVTLELGGKTPAVVDASADVRAAAQRVVWGKFFNAGQTCIAPDFALVHSSVVEQFLAAARDAVAQLYGRDETERRASPDYGRIVDPPHFDRLVDLIERTVAGGARIEVGGVWDADSRYISPTVLSGVTAEAPVMQDEIFGPVLPVLSYSDLAEAVKLARVNGKPLASYVFSRDERVTERLQREIPAGGTMVNNTLLHYVSSELPFGGVGTSGMGTYHGHHGFLAMSHARPVVRQHEPAVARLLFPPFIPHPKGGPMLSRSAVAVALGVLLVPCAAVAQEGEMVLATYFQCDMTTQSRTDEIVKEVFSPVYDGMVESGAISGWGWMSHQTGGKVRRLGYMVGADQAALLDAQSQVISAVQSEHAEAGEEFSTICGAHEDYLWRIQKISQLPSGAPETQAQASMYFYCDMSREARADEIISESYAPILEEMVSSGGLAGWGWLAHDTGGKWRRLLTMAAADFASIFAARAAMVEAIQTRIPEEGTELTSICSTHEDYLWNVVVAR